VATHPHRSSRARSLPLPSLRILRQPPEPPHLHRPSNSLEPASKSTRCTSTTHTTTAGIRTESGELVWLSCGVPGSSGGSEEARSPCWVDAGAEYVLLPSPTGSRAHCPPSHSRRRRVQRFKPQDRPSSLSFLPLFLPLLLPFLSYTDLRLPHSSPKTSSPQKVQ
jgi:hypothetical protein